MRDDEIDFSEIPEQADWSGAVVGKFYRPMIQQVTLRIDADVLAWFKKRAPKYQTALNCALRAHMEKHRKRGS